MVRAFADANRLVRFSRTGAQRTWVREHRQRRKPHQTAATVECTGHFKP